MEDKYNNSSRSEDKKYNVKCHKSRYLFQGPSTISHHWFKLDTECIEETNVTRDTDNFFRIIYQKHIPVQSDKYWIIFSVPIGSAKEPSQF